MLHFSFPQSVMAHSHSRTRIRNQMALLYYAEHVHVAQTRISTPYFCIG